jgi:hypothetical protein
MIYEAGQSRRFIRKNVYVYNIVYLYTHIYREVLTFVDRFTALCFTATGAPPAAKRIRILPMNQLADNVRNQVATIHKSQVVLKILYLYT